MIRIQDLPTVNAVLNGLAATLLILGYVAIRRRRIRLHRGLMLAAFTTSTAFFTCYVIYHIVAGSRPFTGQGWVRPVYYTVLFTHVVLAAALLPLVLVTLIRALRRRYEAHRRLARWTWPIWMYVSVTGVLIYLALYHGT
ncbi:MAG: DUF420 domain-containing protein [Planctomycetota bacterium]